MGETTKKLFQKDITFNEKTDAFNSLRKKYLLLSKEAAKRADEFYSNNIKCIDDYRTICKDSVEGILQEYLNIGVIQLISYGIYDIDEVVLRDELKTEAKIQSEEAVMDVENQFLAIEYEQAVADAERKEMIRDAGSSIQTVGYLSDGNLLNDASNMIQGEVNNAIMNAALAGGTALITGGIRMIEKKAAEKDKIRIFERPSNKENIMIGIEKDVYNLHKTIARLINEHATDTFYYPSEELIARYEPVCRNIVAGNFANPEFAAELEQERIKEVLLMNPYETRVYSYLKLENKTDQDELMDLLNYLCIDKAFMADEYLRATYNLADYGTYEDILEFEKVVIKEMALFEVSECVFSREVANKKERLYELRRTFRGYVYDTIEERDAAEVQFVTFFDDVSLEEMDRDELIQKYYETLPPEITEKNRYDLQEMILEPLEKMFKSISNTDELVKYIADAEAKREEYGFETLTLIDALNKALKRLEMKQKVSAAVGQAKDTVLAMAGDAKDLGANAADAAKNLGKGLMNKVPFGKGKETEVVDKKNCPQCGAEVKAAGKFCGKCGYRF